MSKGALEEVARNIKNSRGESKTLFSQIPPGRNAPREYIGFHMSRKNALNLRKFKLRLEKEKKQKVDFNEVLGELLKIAKDDPASTFFPKRCWPDRFALNGSHNRIVPLCDTHHELAHQGLIGNEEKPPNKWFIRANPDKTHPKCKIDRRVIAYKMGTLNVVFKM